eukprot:12690569-Prorocentrum_lima.AAC.1
MVGRVSGHMRTVLHPAGLGPSYWPYAVMYVADVIRHSSTGRLWNQPAFRKQWQWQDQDQSMHWNHEFTW